MFLIQSEFDGPCILCSFFHLLGTLWSPCLHVCQRLIKAQFKLFLLTRVPQSIPSIFGSDLSHMIFFFLFTHLFVCIYVITWIHLGNRELLENRQAIDIFPSPKRLVLVEWKTGLYLQPETKAHEPAKVSFKKHSKLYLYPLTSLGLCAIL